MKTVFIRADASLAIGTGHVMRCLVLADALRGRGADVHFLCRALEGHLADLIANRGFAVHLLPPGSDGYVDLSDAPPHASWLGALPEEDAAACRDIIAAVGGADLLVVDHYALDHQFEAPLRALVRRIMVIDDLADRRHDCDVLLDQNFGSDTDLRYENLIPAGAQLLLGARYAILRHEFREKRSESLQRRTTPRLENILVFFGGVDSDDKTSQALEGIKKAKLDHTPEVNVVLGSKSPFIDKIQKKTTKMPYKTSIHINTNQMAKLMTEADVSIGAAGTTVLERFCLGLPSIVTPVANNQKEYSIKLRDSDLIIYIEDDFDISSNLSKTLKEISEKKLLEISINTSNICDGNGIHRVLKTLFD
jgi:UDP-2,4-diacetamido-2,4,6-trideoxy-beta-L-altropyranose hydrolase